MRELSLHILDLVENGIRAGGNRLLIEVEESTADDRLTLSVEDNGRGVPEEKVKHIDDPFVTTRKTRRVGLGLSLLASAARRCAGAISVQARPRNGTRVKATFRRSHVDRAPLGDIASTLGVLIAGHPHIDFRYTHKVDEEEFVLDTRDLKTELGGLALDAPMIAHHLTESIRRLLADMAADSHHTPPMENADV